MIEFINVSKTFETKDTTVHAVNDVNLHIRAGEIFGVIGYSGAGKSTLIRLINYLERPTQGEVRVNESILGTLTQKELQEKRKKIGMIFQGFNLYESRTVYENVAFPLRYQGKSKHEIHEKIISLLELTGILDKKDAYPSQLSGGQKQRVAIARALANDPDILLCDEATSALDPQTTQNILKLLKHLNEVLGLTIVIITHEMAVIKAVCCHVAVMEDGYVKEVNDVVSIFSKPQASITQEFVQSESRIDTVLQRLETMRISPKKSIVKLDFLGSNTKESILSQMGQTLGIETSIVLANVEMIQNEILGNMVVVLDKERIDDAVAFLEHHDVDVEVLI